MRDGRSRSYELGRRIGTRHPLLVRTVFVLSVAAMGAFDVHEAYQGRHLGHRWVISVLAGTAAGVLGIVVAVLVHRRRPGSGDDPVTVTWWLLVIGSMAAAGLPIPSGPSDGVQALLGVVHAALLGYGAVSMLAIIVVLVGWARPRQTPLTGRQPTNSS